ncbi:MAG: DNA-3-methyladenine glycosylase [Fimbriimonadales bacterium]|nr:DNA-3-methyladenine glycosylase [Fimbriimonadales bacterium]
MDLRAYLSRHPLIVAPRLLGWRLAKDGCEVRLIELEAYADLEDPGSHAHRRPTRRNSPMFGPPGHAYVYFCYGNHWMVNIVAHEPGRAGAVLVRGALPFAGEALLRSRRPKARSDRDLLNGPGKLAQALRVDGSHSGLDLLSEGSPLRLLPPENWRPDHEPDWERIRVTPRVGLAEGKGHELPWRFVLAEEE